MSALKLSRGMDELEELLYNNSISFELVETSPDTLSHRGKGCEPYFRIEATQLFNNPACAMTYLQKDWRANPFAQDDLASIGVSVSGTEIIHLSAEMPMRALFDSSAQQVQQKIETLIDRSDSLKRGIRCGVFLTPYISLTMEANPDFHWSGEDAFSLIQLFALEVHRIFGSIMDPTVAPASSPRTTVQYSPESNDANGGYFVHSLDGYPLWVIDANFSFKYVVGENVWRDVKDSEAGGLPLATADFENIYYYHDGKVYVRPDGVVIGRYYSKRYDFADIWNGIVRLLNGSNLDKSNAIMQASEMYRLFPEQPLFFNTLQEAAEIANRIRNGNADERALAQSFSMQIKQLAVGLPNDARIQQLSKTV